MVSADDVAALVWSVDVNEFRAQAGISQSGGAQRAQWHESAPQYDHHVKMEVD